MQYLDLRYTNDEIERRMSSRYGPCQSDTRLFASSLRLAATHQPTMQVSTSPPLLSTNTNTLTTPTAILPTSDILINNNSSSSTSGTPSTTSTTPPQRLHWVSVLRILLAICIVYYHTIRLADGYHHNLSIPIPRGTSGSPERWSLSIIKQLQRGVLQAGLNLVRIARSLALYDDIARGLASLSAVDMALNWWIDGWDGWIVLHVGRHLCRALDGDETQEPRGHGAGAFMEAARELRVRLARDRDTVQYRHRVM